VRLQRRQRGRVGLQRYDGRGRQVVDDQLLRRDGGAVWRRLRAVRQCGDDGGRVTVERVVVMVRQQVMRMNVMQMDAVGRGRVVRRRVVNTKQRLRQYHAVGRRGQQRRRLTAAWRHSRSSTNTRNHTTTVSNYHF